jgi:DNA-binding transcriptional MerR regulator
MRIGEVAERAGVSTKAVRYYESLGLLAVGRRPNGYRDYDETQVRLVREIHTLRLLGVPVDETRPFLDCLVSGNPHGDDCSESLDTYRETIDALGTRIAELSARRESLIGLLESASNRKTPCECAAGSTTTQP